MRGVVGRCFEETCRHRLCGSRYFDDNPNRTNANYPCARVARTVVLDRPPLHHQQQQQPARQ